MIREKELRLALICYGGVSLAVYMHGVTKELWKLLRASEARKSARESEGDTELVWHGFLEILADKIDLTIICDILAGASAGGINTVLLANAISQGETLEPLTEMWLEEADVEKLLDPAARPKTRIIQRFAHFYKEPVAWFAARQSETLAAVDVPEVRAEIAGKLASFVRSRWFEPPFSGDVLTAMIDRAMDAMASAPKGPPLVPPTLPLDLFVTVTDYWGVKSELQIHSPQIVTEREHRRLFAFYSPAIALHRNRGDVSPRAQRQPVAERPALLFAARATASFPGAFPAATIGEIDRRLAETGGSWPERAEFVRSQLPSDRAPEDIALIDGSVLNNAPFGPAINAIRLRASHRETDRRFVYVDPNPGGAEESPLRGGGIWKDRPPGFFTVLLRSLADIPREQPIRDSLEEINRISARIRRMKHVTDTMTPAVDAAMVRAIGVRFFILKLTPERLASARSNIQSLAASEAGFAFAAYAQLKLRVVLEEAIGLLTRSARLGRADAMRVQIAIMEEAAVRGAFDHEEATGNRANQSGYVKTLKQLDIGFRVRRISFFIRRLSQVIAESDDVNERAACEELKAALHLEAAPFQNRRSAHDLPFMDALREVTNSILSAASPSERSQAAAAAIDRLGLVLELSALDAEVEQVLVDAARDPRFGRDVRRTLIRTWLGFPFYDIAILPLMHDEAADSFEEMKVDRISPQDSVALKRGGARAMLKGWQLNAFAGFFSRAYRENDYLWGRLHAAERLVDIVASTVPGTNIDTGEWKRRLFAAILLSERPRLKMVQPLFDELEAILANGGVVTPAAP